MKKKVMTVLVVLCCAVAMWAGISTSKQLSITVNPAPIQPVAITTASLPNAQVTVAYSQTLTASGGVPPYTWSVTAGALPTGMTMSTSGVIGGTPTTQGIFNFTATVTDSQATAAAVKVSSTVRKK